MRARRDSRAAQSAFGAQSGFFDHDFGFGEGQIRRPRLSRAVTTSRGGSEEDDIEIHDQTPLLPSLRQQSGSGHEPYLGKGRKSPASSISSKRQRRMSIHHPLTSSLQLGQDVNNPPSVPSSPQSGPQMGYDETTFTGLFAPRSPGDRRPQASLANDQVIDIDNGAGSLSESASREINERRRSLAVPEGDVCFPFEGMSEIAEEDEMTRVNGADFQHGQRRRREGRWPNLSALEEWRTVEKEGRCDGIRTKKISEPVLVGGRLRPQKNGWHRTEEDAPYRFTYFNEEFPSTIHSQTISELLQPGQNFRDLFIPEPPEISGDSSDDEDAISHQGNYPENNELCLNGHFILDTRESSIREGSKMPSPKVPTPEQPEAPTSTPYTGQQQQHKETPKRYGARPTFWLDVLSPTETEMRVLSKTFKIHPLTSEDIMMEEAREKVELFRNYYLVNYRTFEQDINSEDYLQPVNIYSIVFREGVISFHFSMTPHPANVRRRIRQLQDYLILSSDWISYALIDDITDAFGPMIQSIEDEVNDIDDDILQLHSSNQVPANKEPRESENSEARIDQSEKGGDVLRRVGRARKKVMGLYTLLGNKADVIKGFAKRCNEQWEVAPRSEIGLYLGDIQDHLLTMTGNLSHYETILSRAHSNYLAQISISMNERQEQTADVLGKLTVLGTIVLPMNIITGIWGMNVLVPGQGSHSLYWFWSITLALLCFGVSCFFVAKRVYGIV